MIALGAKIAIERWYVLRRGHYYSSLSSYVSTARDPKSTSVLGASMQTITVNDSKDWYTAEATAMSLK